MSQHREHLKRQLEEAEREFDAARKPSDIRAAAQKRRLALEGLRWLDEQERKPMPKPKRGSSRGLGWEVDAS